MFIIERGSEVIKPIENEEALKILLSNCEDAYGFPPYEDIKEFLYLRDGADLREKERAIICQALGGIPTTLISNSNLEWWCRIPTFVDEKLASDLTCEEKPGSRAIQSDRVHPSVVER